ncbi:hypothetical protein [Paraburkholderia sp. 22B1P]|uniref:hypothetical protein n=1 Tax=Paraburkholderia sp. 22B1P TaxID=3080498 RepID=UPI0030868061|nr:membrane protein [Paraburkholderia sp. 22B1P]
MHYVTLFLAGAFLCNCIPHLAVGLQGTPFPTPFAKPRGVGNSSPLVNFLWGSANLLIAVTRLVRHPVTLGVNPECLSLALGALLLGCYLSRHFGKVRRETTVAL